MPEFPPPPPAANDPPPLVRYEDVPTARTVNAPTEWFDDDAAAHRRPSKLRAFLELLALGGVALALPYLFVFFMLAVGSASDLNFTGDERWLNVIVTNLMGLLLVIASLVMVRLNSQPLAAIGWTARDLVVNILIGLATLVFVFSMIAGLSLVLTLLDPTVLTEGTPAQKAIQETFPREMFRWIVPITLWIGIWEETVFRGFVITRLEAIVRWKWLSVLLGGVIFALGHGYQGPLAMVIIFALGLLLGAVFVWRRSLVPCIVVHMLFDFIMFFLLGVTSPDWT